MAKDLRRRDFTIARAAVAVHAVCDEMRGGGGELRPAATNGIEASSAIRGLALSAAKPDAEVSPDRKIFAGAMSATRCAQQSFVAMDVLRSTFFDVETPRRRVSLRSAPTYGTPTHETPRTVRRERASFAPGFPSFVASALAACDGVNEAAATHRRGVAMVIVHIVAGSLALIAGMIALLSRKGGVWHRQAGLAFAIAMLVMTSTGAVMAMLKFERISIIAGVLTFYLVATGVLAVRKPVEQSRGTLTVFMIVALLVGLFGYAVGFDVRADPKTAGWAPMFFVFASIALLSAAFDARLLRRGALHGAQRLSRHLGRMGLALTIANLSFFLGQAKHIPAPFDHPLLRATPILLSLLLTLYWLIRVNMKRRTAAIAAVQPG